jgi:hypothetical protein
MVDAIVVNPRNEQTGGVLQRNYFPMFTQGAAVDAAEAYLVIRLINSFLGITPRRGKAENILARLTASVFVDEAHPGAVVNIGVGMPEEASRLLFESGSTVTLYSPRKAAPTMACHLGHLFWGSPEPEKNHQHLGHVPSLRKKAGHRGPGLPAGRFAGQCQCFPEAGAPGGIRGPRRLSRHYGMRRNHHFYGQLDGRSPILTAQGSAFHREKG